MIADAALHDRVTTLVEARTWTGFDVDDQGRVLAGHDDLGTVQLVELGPDGSRTPLTDLPGKCSGRYLPGRRQVVVQHDQGGDENHQLSLLDLDPPRAAPATLAELTPLVHDPAYLHVLHDVTDRSVVFSTNRRNGVDMDVVVHDLADGGERTVYDGGGYVTDVTVSADTSRVAVLRLSLRPGSTVLDLATPDGGRAVTDPDELALHHHVGFAADGAGLVLSSNHDREFTAIHRLTGDGSWQVLVQDEEHDLVCWVSPDGTAMVVGTLVDGAMRLAVHEADGTSRCAVERGEQGEDGMARVGAGLHAVPADGDLADRAGRAAAHRRQHRDRGAACVERRRAGRFGAAAVTDRAPGAHR